MSVHKSYTYHCVIVALLAHIFLAETLAVAVLVAAAGHRAVLSHVAKVAAAAIGLHAGSVHAAVFADRMTETCNTVRQTEHVRGKEVTISGSSCEKKLSNEV